MRPQYVLVVEDDDDLAEIEVRLLRMAGYSAKSVGDGMAALEAVDAERPALVLLDMLMPSMDGPECARRLRERYGRSLQIVIVTAAEHLLAYAGDTEPDEVLAKPFDVHELLDVVSRYVKPRPAGLREDS